MILILLGPPGAGKGTQAKRIIEDYNLVHISTGDIFRSNIKQETELGLKVKDILASGALVPDELTNDIVFDRLSKDDCKNGFLLDGYPRNLNQAKALDNWILQNRLELTKVLDITVDKQLLIKRISGRRVCPNCGGSYHIVNEPPKVEGICDKCGTSVIQRPDDNEETIRQRIEIYENQTSPLIEYYKKQGKLVEFDGNKSIDEVYSDVKDSLK
ncbi:MAG: adenylate kinase [Tissierellia bacterium]|nr:adenylate kinase [Tissierellia bacterium]